MNTTSGFWIKVSAMGAIFWGILIGMFVTGLAGPQAGYIAGVVWGMILYHLGILVGGLCVTKDIADEYQMH